MTETRAALLTSAKAHGFWFDLTRSRPALILDEVPVYLPRARSDGRCPRSLRSETRMAVASFKASVVATLRPAVQAETSARRLRQYESLLLRDGHRLPHLEVEAMGELALVWMLQDIEDARQRPPLSHLEASFQGWLEKQVTHDGAIVVAERQARTELEDEAGHEVTVRAVRRLATWHGFRRVHARRARLLIRP